MAAQGAALIITHIFLSVFRRHEGTRAGSAILARRSAIPARRRLFGRGSRRGWPVHDERASSRKTKAGTARTTKGRRSRVIPIHPELTKLMTALERRADGRVHAARGGVLRPDNARAILIRDVVAPLSVKFPTPIDEIGFGSVRFHSLRHYFCSQCFLGGASEGEIREWMGHRDSKIVELYRHLRREEALRKMQQIDFVSTSEEAGQGSEVA
jgi:integrase